MLLVLKRSPEHEAALEELLGGQLDKSSPNYHIWLTPEQFGEEFGPLDGDIQAIASWLDSHGFQVVRVSKGRTMIEFTGTAGQVQETIRTEIHKYALSGEEHWANAHDPRIPPALSPVVAGMDSLNNFPRHSTLRIFHDFRNESALQEAQRVNPLFTLGSSLAGR